MNKIILIILTLLIGLQSYAIKPTRTYFNTPAKMDLAHEALRIQTKDGIQQIKTFDCEHISGFFLYPVEYTETIVSFLEQ